jgi:hypothetical protein
MTGEIYFMAPIIQQNVIDSSKTSLNNSLARKRQSVRENIGYINY